MDLALDVIDFRIAEALAIQRMLGEHGLLWIAERLGALALTDDATGAERFRQIAACYRKLMPRFTTQH